jgi:hypothetical protein
METGACRSITGLPFIHPTGFFLPLHFSLHAQWNPTELVALPIPLGKPKEKRSKKK